MAISTIAILVIGMHAVLESSQASSIYSMNIAMTFVMSKKHLIPPRRLEITKASSPPPIALSNMQGSRELWQPSIPWCHPLILWCRSPQFLLRGNSWLYSPLLSRFNMLWCYPCSPPCTEFECVGTQCLGCWHQTAVAWQLYVRKKITVWNS